MSNQVAFITGSSRGIGLAAAEALAKAGFAIALNTLEDDAELSEASKRIQSHGVEVYKAVGDISNIADHEVLLNRIETVLGPITTLVNNAGVGVLQRGDPLEVTEESYDRCLGVNAKAMFFLSQAMAKRWLSTPRDPALLYCIVNVTSSNASAVAVPRSEYCASKAAAAMISKTFATRLGAENIPVYDVQPGLIATDMTKPVIEDYQRRAEQGLCLLPRVGQPEEVGTVIASLATNRLPYTTAQVISVDGGLLVPRY